MAESSKERGAEARDPNCEILVRLISNRTESEQERLKRELKNHYTDTTLLRFIRAGLADLGIEL